MPWVGEDHEPSVAVDVDEARSHDPPRDDQAAPDGLGLHSAAGDAGARGRPRSSTLPARAGAPVPSTSRAAGEEQFGFPHPDIMRTGDAAPPCAAASSRTRNCWARMRTRGCGRRAAAVRAHILGADPPAPRGGLVTGGPGPRHARPARRREPARGQPRTDVVSAGLARASPASRKSAPASTLSWTSSRSRSVAPGPSTTAPSPSSRRSSATPGQIAASSTAASRRSPARTTSGERMAASSIVRTLHDELIAVDGGQVGDRWRVISRGRVR